MSEELTPDETRRNELLAKYFSVGFSEKEAIELAEIDARLDDWDARELAMMAASVEDSRRRYAEVAEQKNMIRALKLRISELELRLGAPGMT